MAIADKLQSLHEGLLAIDVLAPWEDSIGNKLIPLPTCTSFGKRKRLVFHLWPNESQRIYEVNFSRGLCADLCIDMHLDEC